MGKAMRYALLILAIAANTVIGCASAEMPRPENGFKFFDEDVQKRFVSNLQREGIAHRVRSDGTALYSALDEARVSRIRVDVLNEAFVPSAHVGDIALERRFLKRLDGAGIKYAIAERDGKRWISWSRHDDPKVHDIRKALLEGL